MVFEKQDHQGTNNEIIKVSTIKQSTNKLDKQTEKKTKRKTDRLQNKFRFRNISIREGT